MAVLGSIFRVVGFKLSPSYLIRRYNAKALIESIEFHQTKPLKTPRIVEICPDIYSRLGKMRF